MWRHKKIGFGRAVAIIFESGYISLNGSKSVTEARCNMRQFLRILQKMGYEIRLCSIKIQAISACCTIPPRVKVNINDLVSYLGGEYEPEILQACVFKREGVSFVVFPSGSVLITGIRNTFHSLCMVKHVIRDVVILCSSHS